MVESVACCETAEWDEGFLADFAEEFLRAGFGEEIGVVEGGGQGTAGGERLGVGGVTGHGVVVGCRAQSFECVVGGKRLLVVGRVRTLEEVSSGDVNMQMG